MKTSVRTLSILGLWLGLTASLGRAAEPAPGKPAEAGAPVRAVPLKVFSRQEKVGEIDTITRFFVTTETNQFTFILPKTFRLTTDNAEQSLSMTSSDASGLIEVRISEHGGKDKPELKPDKVREALLEDQPDAKVVQEFGASAGNLSGLGFELQWRPAGGAMISSRIAVIPFPGGTIEFSQKALSQRLRQLDPALNQVLLSFRQAPINGTLDFAPLSDKL